MDEFAKPTGKQTKLNWVRQPCRGRVPADAHDSPTLLYDQLCFAPQTAYNAEWLSLFTCACTSVPRVPCTCCSGYWLHNCREQNWVSSSIYVFPVYINPPHPFYWWPNTLSWFSIEKYKKYTVLRNITRITQLSYAYHGADRSESRCIPVIARLTAVEATPRTCHNESGELKRLTLRCCDYSWLSCRHPCHCLMLPVLRWTSLVCCLCSLLAHSLL